MVRFDAGSAFATDGQAAQAFMNTFLARTDWRGSPSSGSATARPDDLETRLRSRSAGLVPMTPACGFMVRPAPLGDQSALVESSAATP